MVVKLTQEQDRFIKTFNDKSLAFYYISSWGWDSFLRDGIGEAVSYTHLDVYKRQSLCRAVMLLYYAVLLYAFSLL